MCVTPKGIPAAERKMQEISKLRLENRHALVKLQNEYESLGKEGEKKGNNIVGVGDTAKT